MLAGQTEVTLAGWYLVSVYGDDGMTTLDEGAQAGDTIAFTVDGYPAVLLGPASPAWTTSGSRLHVELRACTLAGDFDCDCQVTVADLMRQAGSFGVARGEAGYIHPSTAMATRTSTSAIRRTSPPGGTPRARDKDS